MKIAIVMDPIEHINYKKDSSLAMLWAAKKRGHDLHYLTMSDLYLESGIPYSLASPLDVFEDPECFYKLGQPRQQLLADFDAILMRKDPPFDNEYIYATYILERAEKLGTLIVNKPQSLRDCNEKVFATEFSKWTPPNVVTRSATILRDFYNTHKDVIFKPLDGMGGSAIFRLKPDDPNVSVIIETLTKNGGEQIMGQQYLPEIKQGDKRILIVDGTPVDYCLARLPAQGETRGNLAAGGTGRAQLLSDSDRELANSIAPELVKRGLLFVGLDVIGNYITEINVTSPTCIREIDAEYGTDIGDLLIQAIEKRKG